MSLFMLLAAVIYGAGAYKFWAGFSRTNFSSNRLMLTLGWPLLLVNPSYRQNFNRALKG